MIYVFLIIVKFLIENKILMVYIMIYFEMYFDVCSIVIGCNWYDNFVRFGVNYCFVWYCGIFFVVVYKKLFLLIKVCGFEFYF